MLLLYSGTAHIVVRTTSFQCNWKKSRVLYATGGPSQLTHPKRPPANKARLEPSIMRKTAAPAGEISNSRKYFKHTFLSKEISLTFDPKVVPLWIHILWGHPEILSSHICLSILLSAYQALIFGGALAVFLSTREACSWMNDSAEIGINAILKFLWAHRRTIPTIVIYINSRTMADEASKLYYPALCRHQIRFFFARWTRTGCPNRSSLGRVGLSDRRPWSVTLSKFLLQVFSLVLVVARTPRPATSHPRFEKSARGPKRFRTPG